MTIALVTHGEKRFGVVVCKTSGRTTQSVRSDQQPDKGTFLAAIIGTIDTPIPRYPRRLLRPPARAKTACAIAVIRATLRPSGILIKPPSNNVSVLRLHGRFVMCENYPGFLAS